MAKLLQLNATANWGSTGRIAEGIGLTAMNYGWESYIAYGRSMNPSESKLIKVGNQLDIYAHYAKAKFLDSEGLGSKKPTKQLIENIDEIQPDIIHLHNIHDHWLNYPILFEYFATIDTPIVWTFHDCWAFTGGCAHFENVKCFKWRDSNCATGCCMAHKHSEYNYNIRKSVYSKIGSRLNIITVSKWLKHYVQESMFKEFGANISVINNGIDVNNIFKPVSVKQKSILGVSNVWNSNKGLDDFFKIRKILPDEIGMTIVGLSEKQIKNLPIGIKGITRTSNAKELAELYGIASVLVNPTYNDSFPTVNLEALACGTPVITYRTGGSPEAIDENTGIILEKGDFSGLANSVIEIINNPKKYSSEMCRKRAITHFNQEIQFRRYIELYNKLLLK